MDDTQITPILSQEDYEELIREIENNREAIEKHEREINRLNKNPFALFD